LVLLSYTGRLEPKVRTAPRGFFRRPALGVGGCVRGGRRLRVRHPPRAAGEGPRALRPGVAPKPSPQPPPILVPGITPFTVGHGCTVSAHNPPENILCYGFFRLGKFQCAADCPFPTRAPPVGKSPTVDPLPHRDPRDPTTSLRGGRSARPAGGPERGAAAGGPGPRPLHLPAPRGRHGRRPRPPVPRPLPGPHGLNPRSDAPRLRPLHPVAVFSWVEAHERNVVFALRRRAMGACRRRPLAPGAPGTRVHFTLKLAQGTGAPSPLSAVV